MKNDTGLLVLVVRMAAAEVLKCGLEEVSVDAANDPEDPPMLLVTVKKNGVVISRDEDRQIVEYMQKMRILPISNGRPAGPPQIKVVDGDVCPECKGTGHPFEDPKCGRCPTCSGGPLEGRRRIGMRLQIQFAPRGRLETLTITISAPERVECQSPDHNRHTVSLDESWVCEGCKLRLCTLDGSTSAGFAICDRCWASRFLNEGGEAAI